MTRPINETSNMCVAFQEDSKLFRPFRLVSIRRESKLFISVLSRRFMLENSSWIYSQR